MVKLGQHGVVILGAGMTGSGIALSLASRGIAVTLLEQDPVPVNRASLRNEGKIHLGFIYANDATLATARLQLTGALSFRVLLRRWIGPPADLLARSSPFLYLVARDSLLSPSRLEEHYSAVSNLYRELMSENESRDYLDERPDRLFAPCPLPAIAGLFDTSSLAAAYHTAEKAIDPAQLARLLRDAIRRSPLVRFLPRHKLQGLARTNGGFRLEGSGSEGQWRLGATQVVNALWENRIAFDRMLGIECPAGWVHRLKYRVIAQLPEKLHGAPSATMVLGPYGDVVVRGDGSAYLSWYPAGLQGWTHDLAPPPAWDEPCRGEVEAMKRQSLVREILAGIAAWYPAIAESRPLLVDAGAIVAYGTTDVDNRSSALHDRTRVGVTSANGYHSVDPGKLTTAPLFAEEAAERIVNEQGKR